MSALTPQIVGEDALRQFSGISASQMRLRALTIKKIVPISKKRTKPTS
jgi:hypothetical protein